jgi:hypothetical protein
LFAIASFLLPVAIWCVVSYVPAVWHPQILVTRPGSVGYLEPGMRMDKSAFFAAADNARQEKKSVPEGIPSNPIYLPAPHEVAEAFYTSFTTPPESRDGQWLHESLWHSIQIIFWGFVISSLIGVPLGILCGAYDLFSRLNEPFIEFFRYLPAPAFGALAVAILGIYDGPKIAIIVIGTFFQQVLVIANTTRKLDVALVEAALDTGRKEQAASAPGRAARNLAGPLPRSAHSPGLGLDLSDRRRINRHHVGHHLVHHAAGALPTFRQCLCRHHDDRHHRRGQRHAARLAGRRLFPWNRSLIKQE